MARRGGHRSKIPPHMERTPGVNPRALRVGEEIRHVLAELLRGKFRDPALHDLNVTVTEVRMSPDLRNAAAYVLPLGGTNTAEVVAALNHASPYLRGELARSLRLRFAPDISFRADTSFDEAAHIDDLLRRANQPRHDTAEEDLGDDFDDEDELDDLGSLDGTATDAEDDQYEEDEDDDDREDAPRGA